MLQALDLKLTAPTPPVNFDPAEHGDSFGASFLEQLSRPGDSGEWSLGQTVGGGGEGGGEGRGKR